MDRDVDMRIVELTQRDKTLAQKIKTFIGQLLAKLKKIAEDLGLKPDSEKGRLVSGMTDSLRQLHDLWVDALADAGKSYRAAEVSGEKGKVQFAERNHFVEDKYFRTQMAKWENLTHGAYVNVGQIGKKHPLHTVGMPAGVLRYDVDKLKKNMSDHGDYLSVDLLTTIPDIIANPVAISEYSAENTVSVFGDVFVGNSPMMVGVTISKDRAGNDISKVRTFNARRDVGNLITDDSILYLDENKKRTRKWFQACGIQVPLGETKFGFIRIISQKSNFVNAQSKKMSERNLDAVTNREVLATALESAAQNDIERERLAQYKAEVAKYDALGEELRQVRADISAIYNSTGKRDTERLRGLKDRATELENNINTYGFCCFLPCLSSVFKSPLPHFLKRNLPPGKFLPLRFAKRNISCRRYIVSTKRIYRACEASISRAVRRRRSAIAQNYIINNIQS